MKRLCLFLAAVLCLGAACDKKPAAEEPTAKSSAPAVSEKSQAPSATIATAPSAAPLGPGSGSAEERKSAVLNLISGEVSAAQLPEVATEPGEKLDPSLRSSLAPVRAVRIRFGKINVVGDQMPEVVRRIVRQRYPKMRHCYQTGLENNPNLQGRITIQIVIDKGGRTVAVKSASADLPDKTVIGCVVKTLRQLRFPKSDTGQISRVSIPLLFMPQ